MVERSRRVYFSPLPAFVLVLYSVSSTAANTNSTSSNASDTTPNGSAPQPFSCEWKDLEFPITYGPGIASSLCVLIGGFLVILGFKKQRASLFLTGFSSAALLTYIICLIRSSLHIQYVLLITAAVGIFAGILCTTVVFCGLFTSGIVAGFCLALVFLFALASLYQYTTISIPIGVLIGASVLLAGANVWWKRVILIVTSSIYGGALIMGGIDYFIEDLRLLHHVWEKVFIMEITGRPCLFSWIVLGVWPLMVLIGMLVQFLKTGKKPPKPAKDFHNKHYAMGSPFYSAPDDIEMTELLVEQDQAPPTPSLNMDHAPQGSPLLMGEE